MKFELTNPKAWQAVNEKNIPMTHKIKVYEKLGGAYRLGEDGGEQVFNDIKELLKHKLNEEDGADHEVGMAANYLDDIIKNATELKSKVGTDETNLAGWIQDHISQAQNYINQANTGFHKLDGTNESVNEAVSVSQVRSTIAKVKKQLIQKWKQKGGYENFGEKEGRMLSDKFNANPYGSSDERHIHSMIQDFENWAMNYDGRSESVNEGKFNKGDLVRVVDKPKYVSDKQFWGKSGVVTNILNRDILVKFANNRTIVASEKDLILNPTESVNETKWEVPKGRKEVVLSNEILDFLQHRKLITGLNAQLVHKELTAFIKNKIESVNESVNEIAVSDNEMDKIKFAIQRAGSFMRIGTELKNVGIKYSFSTEPLPIYMIKVGGNYFALVNKKFADKPDFVIGDTAGGMMD